MATSVMASLNLKPSPFLEKSVAVKGVPSLARSTSSFRVQASGVKKIKTNTPYGPGGGMNLRDGLDASGRKPKGKGVYQFTDKYGANVDGYSPIYSPEEWSENGDTYAGGTTGLLIWAVTLGAILLGGALLVYNTSALSQ
ncbi:Photosystem ii polypeptide protein [Thalictrum thalictroides]|uniref:Photosystem II 10 kDa polypeptide, chloroplastic n=1 Tax=Thalictrum thalictroides TaxID=46969 RepID=A0A7J6VV24_THATH|nr:Photosystem ii polypeptide protein [Thalictrum thalictroides]